MAYPVDFVTTTSKNIEKALCERLEQLRLARNLTQKELAERSGLSLRTIGRLEQGEGTSLDSFIRVLQALGLARNFETLLPDPTIRPIERARNKGVQRKRASKHKSPKHSAWSWEETETDSEES